MRAPKISKFFLKILARRRDGAYLGDVEEIFLHRAENGELDAAVRWYRREALKSLPLFIIDSIRWRLIMLSNYLKTSIRVFRRDKGYSFLNTAGLSLGLACFILLMLWVRHEVGWDRFHENASSIYRVELESNGFAQPAALAPYLKANYPEIAAAVRFHYSFNLLVKCGEKSFEEGGFVLADPSVFDVFTIPFVAGNKASAFADPDSVVVTEAAAKKYFGTENPVGRVLTVENRFPVRVTGIVRNPPGNSDLQFDVLGDFKILGHFRQGYETNWGNHAYITYVRLTEGADAKTVIPKIARVVMDRNPELPTPLTLRPLGRIHLYADGAIRYITIFSLVAVFILLIAGFNFINLTTARSGRRTKEIAVRKVVGAVRNQLIKQFLSESILLSLGAFLAALIAVALVLPSFNAVTGKDFGRGDLFQPGLFLSMLGTAVAIGALSGAYPALLMSSFRPAGLLKPGGRGAGRSSSGILLRKILVVAQFAISLVLLISTLLIQRQIVFIRDYDLGVKKDNIVVLPVKEPLLKNQEAFVAELKSRPGVVEATFASSLPSQVNNVADGISWEGMDPGYKPVWSFVAADPRYLDTLGLTLVEGRNFSENKPAKDAPYFIVNQMAAAEMKIKNPVGRQFTLWGWTGTVLGVVKDFHFRSLRRNIKPLVLFIYPRAYQQILVKIRPGNGPASEILARIKEVWEKFAPEMPFAYEFLDASYDRNYQTERTMGKEFRVFSFLGIFISCLGLIGLTAYLAERRKKEIGIRKVLGANLGDILGRLNKEFLAPILVSNLIAWPVGYWVMKTWLRGFAFHTDIAPGIFLISTVATLALAMLTISAQSFKAARANPAVSLKNE